MRVGAVIVTYHSDADILGRILALLPQVTRVYMVDNGSDAHVITLLRTLASEYPTQISLIENNNNLGLARAQNQGIRAALAEQMEWVLLMDDDSMADTQMVAHMLTAWQQQQDSTFGIIAPRWVEHAVDIPSRYLTPKWGIGFARKTVPTDGVLTDAATVIASGSLVKSSVFAHIGLMIEDYFIDYVDHEFCLRARANGYQILVVGHAILQHRQGHKRMHHWLGMRVVTRNYHAFRYYYLFRNRLFFLRRYARAFPFLIAHEVLAYAWDIVRLLVLEDDKRKKLYAGARGIWHGLTRPHPTTISNPISGNIDKPI